MTESLGAAVGADLNAEFLFAIGGVKQQLQHLRQENHNARIQSELAKIKNYIPLTQTTVLTVGGAGSVDLGTPALGRTWTVRQLMASVQGSELSAAVTTNVGWYIGTIVPFNAASTPTVQFTNQWRASFANVPAYTTYTSDILQVKAGEHLFAIVTAGSNSATMVFNAIVLDEPMKVGIPTSVQA